MPPTTSAWKALTPSTEELAKMNPEEFVRTITGRGDFPAAAILCGHGLHIIDSLSAVKAMCGGRVPDPITVLGNVSTIHKFYQKGPEYLEVIAYQLREIAVAKHGAKLIFVLIHPLCGGAMEEVLTQLPDAAELYEGTQTTLNSPALFLKQQVVEMQVQKRHLETTIRWLSEVVPGLQVVALRISSGRTDNFEAYARSLGCIQANQ